MDVAEVVHDFVERQGPVFLTRGGGRAGAGVDAFAATVKGAMRHTAGCTCVATHREEGLCTIDGCLSAVAVKHGEEEMWMSACDFEELLIELLTPGHARWADFCARVVAAADAPLFVLDLVLTLPVERAVAVFPSLRENMWRTLTGEPPATAPFDVPPGLEFMIKHVAGAAGVASLAAHAAAARESGGVMVAGASPLGPGAKRLRITAGCAGDRVASAAVYLTARIIARDVIVASVDGRARDLYSAPATELYQTIARTGALQTSGVDSDVMQRVLGTDSPDLFVYLRALFETWAPLEDTLAPRRTHPRHRVVHLQWVPHTPELLAHLMGLARACSKALCDALLEIVTQLPDQSPATVGTNFMARHCALVLRGATVAEASTLAAAAEFGGAARCMAIDDGALVVARTDHVEAISAGALFDLVAHCDDRLPVYPVLARMHFAAAPCEPAWAAAIALALHGESPVACRAMPHGVAHPSPAAAQQVLPDLVERLLGDLPLALLLKPARAPLRHALVCLLTAVVLPKTHPAPSAAVRRAIERTAAAVGCPAEPCLEGPSASANLAALCLRALRAGAITPDHVLQMFTRDRPPAPRPAPTTAPRGDGVWALNALQWGGPVDRSTGAVHRLDADGRRRARAMLRLFALCDFAALGTAPEDADAHLDAIEDACNLGGARSGNAGLAWWFPVYLAPGQQVPLNDDEFAVVCNDYDDARPALLFGRAAAAAAAHAPIPSCAEAVLSACPETVPHRLEIMREILNLSRKRTQASAFAT